MTTSYTPISSVLPPAGTTATPGGTASADPTAKPDDFGKDTFLKLLVAQLQYQNPLSPVDGTQFIAQTAQFTMVEKLDDLEKQTAQLVSTEQVFGASSLVGRSVSYLKTDGTTDSGTVSAASFGTDGVVLKVGAGSSATDVPLAMVQEVTAAQP